MLFLLFLTSILTFSHQESSVWDNLTAKIAVVEYQPNDNQNLAGVNFAINILAYAGEMELLKNESLDMIIFPESTLGNDRNSGVTVELNSVWDGTTDITNTLNVFSFLAASHNTYLIINLVEQAKCEEGDQSKNCKDYGFHFYNTDVVFDRKGTVINKYRKYNLFGEYEKDQPPTAEQVIIKTDFGVNFGIFTCFDILFKSPAQDLVGQGIDGIIFPTMWFGELPFLTAMQAQQMWAQTHDVTFFAAGANNPAVGSGGSGVYRGARGGVLGGYVAEGGTKEFIYKSDNGNFETQEAEDVDTVAKTMDNFYLKRDRSLDDSNSTLLDTSQPLVETQLCYENGTETQLCCNFTLKMSQNEPKSANYYTYHLLAFSGVRSFDGVYNGGVEYCAIVACLNSSSTSCGYRFPDYDNIDWPVTFDEITIVATFEKSENKTQFPNSLLSSIRPIGAEKTSWSGEVLEEDGTTVVRRTWSLTQKQERVLTFAIYGRDFGLDFAPPDSDDGDNDDKGPNGAIDLRGISFGLLMIALWFGLNLW